VLLNFKSVIKTIITLRYLVFILENHLQQNFIIQ